MNQSHLYLRPCFGRNWATPPALPVTHPEDRAKTSEDQKCTAVVERVLEEPGLIHVLPEEILGVVFSYLDVTSAIIASRVSPLWKRVIQCVLWETQKSWAEGFKVNLNCLAESFDQLHFPATYERDSSPEEMAKYSVAKKELQKWVQELNNVPETVHKILYYGKFPALKIKEILAPFPSILTIAGNNILCSLAKKHSNEEEYAVLKKLQGYVLDRLYQDPYLLALAEQNSLPEQKWQDLVEEMLVEEMLDETIPTVLTSSEFVKKMSLIHQKMSTWNSTRSVLAILNQYQIYSESFPIEKAQLKNVITTLDQLIGIWDFEDAESLVNQFVDYPQYNFSSSGSSNPFAEENLSYAQTFGPKLMKKWTKALPAIVRNLILLGDFENAFRLAISQKRLKPELMFQLIEEIGNAYTDLGQHIHVESILSLLGEKSDTMAREAQCGLINYQGFKLAKEGKSEEALACANRCLDLLYGLWLENDDTCFFDDLLRNHSGILILLSKIGHLGKAREFVQDALDVFSRNQTQKVFLKQFFQLNIFALLCKMGDFDEAIRIFNAIPDSAKHHYRKKHNTSLKRGVESFIGDLIEAGAVDMISLQKCWRVIDLLIGDRAKRKALVSMQKALQKASESIDPMHQETYDQALQDIHNRLA